MILTSLTWAGIAKSLAKNETWQNPKNKSLCENMITNLMPTSLLSLDKLGFNHLEIISLSQMAGKRMDTLPHSSIEVLDILEDKYNCVFNKEDKLNNKIIIYLDSVSTELTASLVMTIDMYEKKYPHHKIKN